MIQVVAPRRLSSKCAMLCLAANEFDGADDWLFLHKIKPAKRAVSFNIFLIIEADNAAFR
jgi:hypothetical protein